MGVNIGFQFYNENGDYLKVSDGFTDYGNVLLNSPIFEPVFRWEQIKVITHNIDGIIYAESYFKVLELKFKIQKKDLDFFFFENSYNESAKPKIYLVDEVINKFNKYVSVFDTEDFSGISVKNKNTNKLISHFPQNYPFSEIDNSFDHLIKEEKESRRNYLQKLQTEKWHIERGERIELIFVKETTLKAYKNVINEFSNCLEKHRGYYVAGTWW